MNMFFVHVLQCKMLILDMFSNIYLQKKLIFKMGKKNKKEKKGQGKEKTQQKAEKNAKKRQKKELAEKGEVNYDFFFVYQSPILKLVKTDV